MTKQKKKVSRDIVIKDIEIDFAQGLYETFTGKNKKDIYSATFLFDQKTEKGAEIWRIINGEIQNILTEVFGPSKNNWKDFGVVYFTKNGNSAVAAEEKPESYRGQVFFCATSPETHPPQIRCKSGGEVATLPLSTPIKSGDKVHAALTLIYSNHGVKRISAHVNAVMLKTRGAGSSGGVSVNTKELFGGLDADEEKITPKIEGGIFEG
ncbi:MAG: hypothetical protein DRJ03_07435 [Chloroflexi bacterium]|nr:MAG: hypothetical protein DRJ03_07435 [Chloroflexota bacterium]